MVMHYPGNNTNYEYRETEISVKDYDGVYQTGSSIPAAIGIPRTVRLEG